MPYPLAACTPERGLSHPAGRLSLPGLQYGAFLLPAPPGVAEHSLVVQILLKICPLPSAGLGEGSPRGGGSSGSAFGLLSRSCLTPSFLINAVLLHDQKVLVSEMLCIPRAVW